MVSAKHIANWNVNYLPLAGIAKYCQLIIIPDHHCHVIITSSLFPHIIVKADKHKTKS